MDNNRYMQGSAIHLDTSVKHQLPHKVLNITIVRVLSKEQNKQQNNSPFTYEVFT